jgi:hypothetical protein
MLLRQVSQHERIRPELLTRSSYGMMRPVSRYLREAKGIILGISGGKTSR